MSPEIERATLGYVNSGVLRQWIVKGYIQAGPKAKLPGGPRTFSYREVVKASLMAELRQMGICLDTAAAVAELIIRTVDEWDKSHQGNECVQFVLINQQCDQVTLLGSPDISLFRLVDVAFNLGLVVLVLMYANIIERVFCNGYGVGRL